jgi:GAF domain-containing protein
MVDHNLLKSLKRELSELQATNQDLKDENEHLWKVIQALNALECTQRAYSSSEEIFNMVMEILVIALEAVESKNGSILLLDEETQELVFVAVIGDRQKELTGYRIPGDSGVAGWVNRQRKPALVSDVRKDNRWMSAVDQSIGFHTQSLMAVPLAVGDRVLGVMEVVNSLREDHFTSADLDLLLLVARLASYVFGCTEDALEKKPNPFSPKYLN